MHRNSITLVRASAASLTTMVDRLADDLLDHLTRSWPELSRSITWDREQRRRDLVDTFTAVLKYAGHPQTLAARLTLIAAANDRRGVRRDHYEYGRETLLALLHRYSGARWSPELAAAWHDFLDHVLMQLSPPPSFDEAIAA